MQRFVFSMLAVAGATAMAQAQFAYVPNANQNAAGTAGLNTFIRDINAPRAGQLAIGAAQLAGITPGHYITGMSFRLFTGATSNFPGATWTDYSVWIGPAINLNSMTTTFATNFSGAATQVRSGSLTMGANSYTFGAVPNAWGDEISFQNGYQYTGGDIVIEIRHTGSNITNPANTFLDAVASNPTLGYRSFTATTYAALTGAAANFTITRLSTSPVPEPGTFVAVGAGIALLALRRRRK